MIGTFVSATGVRTLYVLAFGLAALACFAGIRRTDRIDHDDTRRGLRWLLVASGVWGAAHVGYLLAPTVELQYAFFVAGLVVGFAAVGPWLYFCSAYTGRSFHRNPTVRRIALATLGVVTAVKVTNPLHGAYFEAVPVEEPFGYLAVTHEPLHWVAMGIAYSASFVGFFMLFEVFVRVNSDTRPLFVLVGLTGLPVVLDVLGVVWSSVLNISHSPLGVSAFSIGLLYVYLEQFRVVRAAGEDDDAIVVLDDEGRVRDFNRKATDLLPALRDTIGERFADQFESIGGTVESGDAIVELDVDGAARYYDVASNPFSTGQARTGRTIVFNDITHRERYRRQLEQQNEQLEQFASIVSHDLRNPLSVAQGWTETAIESGDTDELTHVVEAHDRMNEIIEEILTLAREGTPIDDVETLDLGTIAERSWSMVDSGEATLVVEDDRAFPLEADPERLQQLFENLFRNALEHGAAGEGADADSLTVTVGALPDREGFFIEDDGVGIPAADREEIFSPGYTTSEDGTGFGLSIVGEIVEAHGWEIAVTEGRDGGARFEITTTGDGEGAGDMENAEDTGDVGGAGDAGDVEDVFRDGDPASDGPKA